MSMKARSIISSLSGWIVAATFAGVLMMRTSAPTEAPSSSAHEPEVEPTPTVEVPDAEEESFSQPGDDWEPPGKIDSPEGLYVFLRDASPEDQDIADRIIAARKSGDRAALLSAAVDGKSSPEPIVRAMAAMALREMPTRPNGSRLMNSGGYGRAEDRRKTILTPGEERTRTGLLLAFSCDENDYIKSKTSRAFLSAFASTCDFEVARDMFAASFDALMAGDCGFRDRQLGVAATWALGVDFDETDPERFEKGMQVVVEYSGREGWERLHMEDNLLHLMVEEDVGALEKTLMDPTADRPKSDILKDVDKAERAVARWKAHLEDAQARFCDDYAARRLYANNVLMIDLIAKMRFGGHESDEARAWISELQPLVAKRLSERDKSKPPPRDLLP